MTEQDNLEKKIKKTKKRKSVFFSFFEETMKRSKHLIYHYIYFDKFQGGRSQSYLPHDIRHI